MAYTVISSFNDFLTNLNITDRQSTVVSTCRTNVINAIKKELTLNDTQSLLIGSWDRNTLVKYLSEGDVDVMVILHYSNNKDLVDGPNSETRTLNKFKDILQSKYPNTEMRRDRHCITMKLSQFTLDVVPAIEYTAGGYRIPDSVDGKWINTNPIKFAELITSINKNTDGMVIPVIKMLKAWNRNIGYLLSGYHIECMAYNHYKNYTEKYTYGSTLQVFFSKLSNYLTNSTYDPISSSRVDTYLDNSASYTNRQIAINKAISAASKSTSAVEMNEKGYNEKAIILWKDIFGDFFPIYG